MANKLKLYYPSKTFHNERWFKLPVRTLLQICNIIKLLMIKITKMKQNALTIKRIKIIIKFNFNNQK